MHKSPLVISQDALTHRAVGVETLTQHIITLNEDEMDGSCPAFS